MAVSKWRKKQATTYATKMNKKKYRNQSKTLNRMGRSISKKDKK